MFPARAGVSRALDYLVAVAIDVPRASGGEPPEADITEQMRQRSLREWG